MARTVRFRDSRGRFRKALDYESNEFFTTNTLVKGIAEFEFKMNEAIQEKMVDFAIELIEYMRLHAPWEDQTGDARAGLDAEVYAEPEEMGIILFHSVDYGIWLEVRWGGKYAIIIPTVEQKSPEMLASLRGMMDRIVFYA